MANISGSCSAHIKSETSFFPDDQQNHQLQISEIQAIQKSPDPSWNNARLVYHGFADLLAGNGTQRGYFCTEHADGDRDCGTFDGKVITTGGDVKFEGTFIFTSGTGKLQGIKGNGRYNGRLVSPTEIQMNWTAAYEVGTVTGKVA